MSPKERNTPTYAGERKLTGLNPYDVRYLKDAYGVEYAIIPFAGAEKGGQSVLVYRSDQTLPGGAYLSAEHSLQDPEVQKIINEGIPVREMEEIKSLYTQAITPGVARIIYQGLKPFLKATAYHAFNPEIPHQQKIRNIIASLAGIKQEKRPPLNIPHKL